jgi:hypothetical protein
LFFLGTSFARLRMGIELCDLNPDNATIRQTNKNIHPRLWAVEVRVGYRSAIQPQASQQTFNECRFPLEVRHDKSSDCDLTNGQPIVAANLICRLPDYSASSAGVMAR